MALVYGLRCLYTREQLCNMDRLKRAPRLAAKLRHQFLMVAKRTASVRDSRKMQRRRWQLRHVLRQQTGGHLSARRLDNAPEPSPGVCKEKPFTKGVRVDGGLGRGRRRPGRSLLSQSPVCPRLLVRALDTPVPHLGHTLDALQARHPCRTEKWWLGGLACASTPVLKSTVARTVDRCRSLTNYCVISKCTLSLQGQSGCASSPRPPCSQHGQSLQYFN